MGDYIVVRWTNKNDLDGGITGYTININKPTQVSHGQDVKIIYELINYLPSSQNISIHRHRHSFLWRHGDWHGGIDGPPSSHG